MADFFQDDQPFFSISNIEDFQFFIDIFRNKRNIRINFF